MNLAEHFHKLKMKLYERAIKYKEILLLLLFTLIFFWKIIIYYNQMISPAFDTIGIFSFWRWLYSSTILQYGELPLWNPYIFSGTTFLSNPQTSMFYPINVLFILFPSNLTFGYVFMLDVFLMGVFTYLFARTIELSKFSSLISAIVFMFSGTVTSRIYAGHLNILDAFVWFPLILLFYEMAIKERKLVYGIMAGFALALMFFTGHTQFIAYGLMASVMYFIFRSYGIIKKESNSRCILNLAVILFVSIVVLFSLIAIQLLPTLEFSNYADRAGGISFKDASTFSLTPQYFITFIIPEFFGSPINNTYWHHGNLWEICGYAGVLPLILALIGIIYKKNTTYKYIFLGLALFALLFSLGKYTPIFILCYNYIPGFDLFRAPARFLFVYMFSISILAGLGSSFLTENISRKQLEEFSKFTKYLILISIFSIIVLILSYFAKSFIISFGQSIITENYLIYPQLYQYPLSYWYDFTKIVYSTILQSSIIFIIFLVASTSILSLKAKGKINLSHFQYIVILFILLDLFAFGWNFIDTKNPDDIFKAPEYIKLIKNDDSRYRVLGQLDQTIASKLDIELVNGYDSSYLRLYQDFLWLSGNQKISNNPNYSLIIDIPDISEIHNLNILCLLNIKYIITEKEPTTLGFYKVYNQNNLSIYEVNETMPRAFIIRNARIIQNKSEMFNVLQDNYFNITEEILLEQNPGVPIHNSGKFETAKIARYTPNRIDLEINMTNPGFLVLSEIWYPGWKAYDNNQKSEVYKTDYALRSIFVVEGEHHISFIYEPESYSIGKEISGLSLIIFIFCIIIFRNH
jgi:hypothetical protein